MQGGWQSWLALIDSRQWTLDLPWWTRGLVWCFGPPLVAAAFFFWKLWTLFGPVVFNKYFLVFFFYSFFIPGIIISVNIWTEIKICQIHGVPLSPCVGEWLLVALLCFVTSGRIPTSSHPYFFLLFVFFSKVQPPRGGSNKKRCYIFFLFLSLVPKVVGHLVPTKEQKNKPGIKKN